jgi:hypothetical protein
MKGAIQKILTGSTSAGIESAVFNTDATTPFVTITTLATGAGDMYAYYGWGKAGTALAGQKVAVIVNGKNGSMAGVNQLLTGLKSGSVDVGGEFVTIKLLSAAEQKAGNPLTSADTGSNTVTSTVKPVVKLNATDRVFADFKKAWGNDKQKVAHMAFADVRPSEATPGQVKEWKPSAFPAQTIAMQGFGVVVNHAMYKALMARDVREGRITDADCNSSDASLLLGKCQPNVSSADMAALITGKVDSAAAFLRDTAETRVLNLNRRPASSGTQAATQIRFAGQANYYGKPALATGFDMIGDEIAGVGTTANAGVTVNPDKMIVRTHSGTSLLLAQVGLDSGLSIGVASLDNKAADKFGAPTVSSGVPAVAAVTAAVAAVGSTPAKDAVPQVMRWVKVDGISPDYKATTTNGVTSLSVDSDQRAGLQNGYSFAMEFQTLKASGLTGAYLAIHDFIVDGLKKPAANLTGVAYINSTDTTKNTTWTRGNNNNFPLNKY